MRALQVKYLPTCSDDHGNELGLISVLLCDELGVPCSLTVGDRDQHPCYHARKQLFLYQNRLEKSPDYCRGGHNISNRSHSILPSLTSK
ncbi:hypothetical protein ILYODFUR_027059, partial [Ilyodon furcidens]